MQENIIKAFLSMKRQHTLDLVEKALHEGIDPLALLKTSRQAMERIGKKFETGEFFLSELIYSAEVFKGVVALLEPHLMERRDTIDSRGTVVFGTPQGDIHDLGKNIVATMLRAHGFIVHDLGVDVPPETFLEELHTTGAPILALSALITTAFVPMKKTISLLEEDDLRNRTYVIIGGGVTNEMTRREVGADAQTLDPTEAVRLCMGYLNTA